MSTTSIRNAGFTLVELAIVLVIIGLLVGGVLVGQDLIKQAEMRSTVEFVNSSNAAVNTFRSKFGGFPGDLLTSRAAQFAFTARTGADSRGDGDAIVEGFNGTASTANALGSENGLFWRDLAQSDLISSGFVTATDGPAASLTTATMQTWLPRTRLRESTYATLLVSGGRNYYYFDQISSTNATGVIASTGAGLTPLEAQSLDEKLDDGSPFTGGVLATQGIDATLDTTPNFAPEVLNVTPSVGLCVTEITIAAVARPVYNVAEDFANAPSCGLLARASF